MLLGFLLYTVLGTLLLCLPFSQTVPVSWLDHLFTATSAVSTTGLATVATGDTYSWFGELVVLSLFQVGAVGYMTLSSFVLLARGQRFSRQRSGVLQAGFALPGYFDMRRFVQHVFVFSLVIQSLGAAMLYPAFLQAGEDRPLWSAIFHSVSAFCTAGFSLNATSLEAYAENTTVNAVIAVLAYLGAVGFIVLQDIWYSVKFREHMITFTSKVILAMTAILLFSAVPPVYFLEPSLQHLDAWPKLLAAVFQVVNASTTAGFNSVPLGEWGAMSVMILILLMAVGASPSGTGGGIKTTTLSALLATVASIARRRERVTLAGNEIPLIRVLNAVASATLFVAVLGVLIVLLAAVDDHPLHALAFEATSALATAGLSLGITGSLSPTAQILLIFAMFIGRLGPLTLGIALLRPEPKPEDITSDDLVT